MQLFRYGRVAYKIHPLKYFLIREIRFETIRHWVSAHGHWLSPRVCVLAVAAVLLLALWMRRRGSKPRKVLRRGFSRYFTAGGYVRQILPSGRHKLEHRLVAENIMGRPLEKWQVVHHINGRRADNRPENLCVMDRLEHIRYHKWYRRVAKSSGKPPQRKMQLCALTEDYGGTPLEIRSPHRKVAE